MAAVAATVRPAIVPAVRPLVPGSMTTPMVAGRPTVAIGHFAFDPETPQLTDVRMTAPRLQRLALGGGKCRDEGVQAEKAPRHLDDLPALGELFGTTDRRLPIVESLPP